MNGTAREKPSHLRRWLTLGVLTVCAAGIAVCRSSIPEAGTAEARRQLAAVLRNVRPFEARLSVSGGVRGPYLPTTRGSVATSRPPDMTVAMAHLEKAAGNRDDADGLAARGLARLVGGDVTSAISLLSDALLEQPTHADALDDLSAAYFSRGAGSASASDLVRALDAAERAAPQTAAGRFNRALVLEAIGLPSTAEAAWNEYVGSGPEDDWREEARRRLAALRERTIQGLPAWERARAALLRYDAAPGVQAKALVRVSPQWTRECLEDEVLPAWGAAVRERNRARTSAIRNVAVALADAITAATGLPWAADVVAPLRSSAWSSDRLAILAAGLVAFGRGRALTESDEWQQSVGALEEARRQFHRMGSPLALTAALELASAAYHRRDLDSMQSLLLGVEREALARRYPSLLGRAAWLRATDAIQRQRRSEAAAHIERAIAEFDRAGEPANRVAAHNLAASNWRELGEHARSWQHMALALQNIDTIRSLRRRYVIQFNASLLALRDGLPYASLRLQDTAVETARARRSAGPIVESLIRRARLHARLGHPGEAEEDLRVAEAATSDVHEGPFRDSYRRWVRVIRAELAVRQNPAQALALLDDDTVSGLAARERVEAAGTYYLRGLAGLGVGDVQSAARDFDAGVEAVEHTWASLNRDEHRLGLFDDVADLFASAARLRLASGDLEGAFAYAERSRGRALAAALGIDGLLPSFDEVRRVLPPRTTMVFFLSTGDTLEVLVVRGESTSRASVPVPRREVERLARRLERHVRGSEPKWRASAERLDDALIAPVRASLRPGDTLVLVPEGWLHRIPYAVLRNARTGRFLIQDHALTIAPSARVAVAAFQRAAGAERRGGTLIVAAPGGRVETGLRSLRAAEGESVAVARSYAASRVLSGVGATKRAVLEAASVSSVVHFAAHAVADERNPEASRLLLPSTGSRPDDGDLRASEITAAAFGRAALVVLGACSTADGDVYRTEGVMSLARPFLAVGVPSVVATLWDVDDDAAAFVLPVFHREFSRHGDAAGALRAAQLAAIGSGDPRLSRPSAWAVFEVLGGTAPRTGADGSMTWRR